MVEVSTQQDVPKAVLRKGDQAVAVLTTMAVTEHSRKQGIGTALLSAAEEWTRTCHPEITSAALFVYRNNHDAIRLAVCYVYHQSDASQHLAADNLSLTMKEQLVARNKELSWLP